MMGAARNIRQRRRPLQGWARVTLGHWLVLALLITGCRQNVYGVVALAEQYWVTHIVGQYHHCHWSIDGSAIWLGWLSL